MKKAVKGMLSLAVAGVLGLGNMTVYAGEWKVDASNGEYWYQNDDGSYTKNDWQLIDGKWYHFNEDGYRQEGWWDFPTVHTYTISAQTFTEVYDESYYLDRETGEMVTNKNWEGGCLCSDGTLACDEIYINENGEISYWRNMYSGKAVPAANMDANGNYAASLGWKTQMLREWYNQLSPYGEYGSFSMDYQLPANWGEECPVPLMTAAIDYMCFTAWGGADIVNWTDSWSVDENNVIHIKADYFEYQR